MNNSAGTIRKSVICHIATILTALIAIILCNIIFVKFCDVLLFSSMLLMGFGISLISFFYSSKKGRPMHHWQFALLCLPLLIPPIIYHFVVGQNNLCTFLILFISTICAAVFIEDIPDFIVMYKKLILGQTS